MMYQHPLVLCLMALNPTRACLMKDSTVLHIKCLTVVAEVPLLVLSPHLILFCIFLPLSVLVGTICVHGVVICS